jgi:hypothetical protein
VSEFCVVCAGVVLACFVSIDARAGLVLNTGPQQATASGNLVVNGSFETAAPPVGFGSTRYWATGTTLTPFMVPPGWTSSGASQTYARWGNDGVAGNGIVSSDAFPDGVAGLYFGNATTTVDQTPTYHADGTVTFPIPPTFSPFYGQPCVLTQTVPTQLSPAPSYVLNFWVSGEDAKPVGSSAGANWGEGIMGLRVTNVLPGDPIQYLTVPSEISANPSRRYEFFFTPLNTSLPVTLEFINWGHVDTPIPFTSELVMDDVIVNAVVPEPAATCAAAAAMFLRIVLRRRPRFD